MPRVMDNLMPHMIGDVVPLVTDDLIAYLKREARGGGTGNGKASVDGAVKKDEERAGRRPRLSAGWTVQARKGRASAVALARPFRARAWACAAGSGAPCA